MERNTAEIIVKVLAALSWLGAIICLIGAVALFAAGTMSTAILGTGPEADALAVLGPAGGIFLLVFAAIYIAVGVGLWQYRNWARITALVLSVLSLLSSLPMIISGVGILSIIINGIIIWLLGFDGTVKSLFGASSAPAAAKAAPAKVAPTKAAPKKATAKKKQ
jgi:hypothetical protein